MIRKVLLTVLVCCITFSICNGQALNPDDKIKIDDEIISGQLDNGIKYYIKKNTKPENRAQLRLIVNAGSILEDEDQQGLAHFTEHMCFNGTKNFQKNDLIKYLESLGMRFGPEINAITSFDQTIYMLELPTDTLAAFEKGFQILVDWAHNVSFEDEEIDKERGVIVEEWRRGRGAVARLRDKQYPKLFKDSKYAVRLPIGKKEIIENFDYPVIKRFYKDWYRPDLMTVVVTGDFDLKYMENLVSDRFSKIPAHENPRERKYFDVPDQDSIYFVIASDKELTGSSAGIFYRLDVQKRETIRDYKKYLSELLFNNLMGARLRELTEKPQPPFVMGYSSKERFLRTKELYFLGATLNEKNILGGFEAIITEAERIKKYGFTEGELERQKKILSRILEKRYSEKDKTESSFFAGKLTESVLYGYAMSGFEEEYELQKSLIPQITLDDVNVLAKEWIKDNNYVVTVSTPEKEGNKLPTEKELREIITSVKSNDIKPYVDKFVDAEIIEEIPAEKKITDEKYYKDIDVTEITLENGIKVAIKPTSFKNDEIMMRAFSFGGTSLIPDSLFMPASSAPSIIKQSGVGKLSSANLRKKLSGKDVRVSPYMSELVEGLACKSSPNDIETMFQLIYSYFYNPRVDEKAFQSYLARIKALLANRGAAPSAAYKDTLTNVIYQRNLRRMPWTIESTKEMDMNKSLEIYKERFADASDFVFAIVGNIDVEQIKKFSKIYLANLPAINREETFKDLGILPPKGKIEKTVRKGIAKKGALTIIFTGNMDWNEEEAFNMRSMVTALKARIREEVREEKGGTYSVGVSSSSQKYPTGQYEIDVAFECNPDRIDELTSTVFEVINRFQSEEISEDELATVKEKQIRQRELNLKDNDYWVRKIEQSYYLGLPLERISTLDKMTTDLTAEDIKSAANKYLTPDNYIKIDLRPEN